MRGTDKGELGKEKGNGKVGESVPLALILEFDPCLGELSELMSSDHKPKARSVSDLLYWSEAHRSGHE